MSDLHSFDWSQQGMLIVEDSEPDPLHITLNNPIAMLSTLPALNPDTFMNGDIAKELQDCNGVPVASFAPNQDPDSIQPSPGGGSQGGDNDGGEEAGSGGGGAGGGLGPAGGGGGDGGGQGEENPDDNGGEGVAVEGDEEEEEEENSTPSDAAQGTPPPGLLAAPTSVHTPPRHIPANVPHRETAGPSGSHAAAAASRGVSDDDPGGISEASTAVVSDTEGRGQIIRHGRAGTPQQQVPEGVTMTTPRELSSNVSTMSSSITSSSSGTRTSHRIQAKRGAAMTSSEYETTPERSLTARKTTAGKKEDDDEEDLAPSFSQVDMFGDEEEDKKKTADPEAAREMILTPASKIQSLSLSGQVPLAHDSDSGEMIPPSVDVYDTPPHLVPNSPSDPEHNTSMSAQEGSQKANSDGSAKSRGSSEEKPGTTKQFPLVQEWQPSYHSMDVSSRSRSSSTNSKNGRKRNVQEMMQMPCTEDFSQAATADSAGESQDAAATEMSMQLQLTQSEAPMTMQDEGEEEAGSQLLNLQLSQSQHASVVPSSQSQHKTCASQRSSRNSSQDNDGETTTGGPRKTSAAEKKRGKKDGENSSESNSHKEQDREGAGIQRVRRSQRRAESPLPSTSNAEKVGQETKGSSGGLKLSMIETQTEGSENITAFHIDRPTIETVPDTELSEQEPKDTGASASHQQSAPASKSKTTLTKHRSIGSVLELPSYMDIDTMEDVSTAEQSSDEQPASVALKENTPSTESVQIIERDSSSYEYVEVDSEIQVCRKKVKTLDYEGETESLGVSVMVGDTMVWGEPTFDQEKGEEEEEEEAEEVVEIDMEKEEEVVKEPEGKDEEEVMEVEAEEVNNNSDDKQEEPNPTPVASTSKAKATASASKNHGKKKTFTRVRPKTSASAPSKRGLNSSSTTTDESLLQKSSLPSKLTPRSKAKGASKPWETPKSKRKIKTGAVPRSTAVANVEDPNDPFAYRMSQSQREEEGRIQVVEGLRERARERTESEAVTPSSSSRRGTEDTSHVTFETTGIQTSQGLSSRDQKASGASSAAGQHTPVRRYRMITTIETVTRRTLTMVDEMENGQLVNSYVMNEDVKELSKNINKDIQEVTAEEFSPQRSVHTSGELADVSSLSRSSRSLGSSKSSSSTTSGAVLDPLMKRKQSLLINKTLSSGSLGGATPAPSPILPHLQTSTNQPHDTTADRVLSTGLEAAAASTATTTVTLSKASSINLSKVGSKQVVESVQETEKFDSKDEQAQQQAQTLTLFSESLAAEDNQVTDRETTLKKNTSSSSSYKPSESLFTSDKNITTDKSSSSSVLRQSASLFSTSSETVHHDAEGFTKPSELPPGSSRRKSSVGSLSKSSSSSFALVAAEEKSPELGKATAGRKREAEDKEVVAAKPVQEDKMDVTESTSTEKAEGKTEEDLAIYQPTGILPPGTSVLAMWRDRHYYPGHVMHQDNPNKCTVAFVDGGVLNKKATDIVVCKLLPVGQECLAMREEDWQEPAVVTGYYEEDGDTAGYTVQYTQDQHVDRVSNEEVSLRSSQVEALLKSGRHAPQKTAGKVKEVRDPAEATTTDTDVIPPTDDEVRRPKKQDKSKPPEKTPHKASKAKEEKEEEASAALMKTPTASKPPEIHPPSPGRPNLPENTFVLAKWPDKFYYPGRTLSYDEPSDMYRVMYEDGDIRKVRCADFIVCELVGIGHSVFAIREAGWKENAVVAGHYSRGKQVGYFLHFDDGARERFGRGDILLNHDMIRDIMGENTSLLATPKYDDVSLDNLMAGKRRRILTPCASPLPQSKAGSQEGSQESASGSHRKRPRTEEKSKGGSQCGSTSTPGQSTSKKRRIRDIEPTATSTPTPKRTVPHTQQQQPTTTTELERTKLIYGRDSSVRGDGGGRGCEVRSDSTYTIPEHKTYRGSSYPTTVIDSPQTTSTARRTTRKVRAELFSDSKGPLPHKPIFQGLAFLLTHVEAPPSPAKSSTKKDTSTENTTTTTDDSVVEEEDTVSFDKDHLTAQIQTGGGVVLEKFEHGLIQSLKQCFLISNNHQRTLKYFNSLAAGLPCVSHIWIRDSCKMNEIQDYKSYCLPAGMNIENSTLMEWSTSPSPLRSLRILLSSRNERFIDSWSQILHTAGCKVLSQFPRSQGNVDVVVGDRELQSDVLAKAESHGTPVVSAEWVVQCLITCAVRPFTGHAKYRHDF